MRKKILALIIVACVVGTTIPCNAAIIDPPKIGVIMDEVRRDAKLASYELSRTGFVDKVLNEAKVTEPTLSEEPKPICDTTPDKRCYILKTFYRYFVR